MNNFKVQLVKQQPLASQISQSKPSPKLNVNIESIVCLNYPIETLVQVIGAHFEQEPCAANLVVKALKVISISLKDKELRAGIQKIFVQNMHKRQKVFTLFLYWSSFTLNLMPTFRKLELKIVQNMLGCVISEYLFTACGYAMQISQPLSIILQELTPQSYIKVCQHVKNQFMSMNCPFEHFMSCKEKFKTKNQKVFEFLSEIGNSIVKSKQSELSLRELLKQYFKNAEKRSKIDDFFLSFPNLISNFVASLRQVLEKNEVLDIWSNCSRFQLEQPIRSAIKEWISVKENYWNIFEINFQKRTEEELDKWKDLLELGYELDEDSIVPQFLIKQNLYNYFSGIDFDSNLETKTLQRLASDRQSFRQMHSIGQTMNDILKSFGNVSRQPGVSLLVLNKVHAIENWARTDLSAIKAESHPLMIPFVEKLKELLKKVEKKADEKGQKIQLVYHVIKVSILSEDKGNKKWALLTFSQLSRILKTNKIQIQNGFMEDYHPTESQAKKVEPKKEIHSIVVEAKIVRIMKKQKNKLAFNQIFDQVIKQIPVSEEAFRLSLDKVISKGLVNAEAEGLYSYCP